MLVSFSNPEERPDIEGDESNSAERNKGKVLFMRFSKSDKLPSIELVRKALIKYGTLTRVFHKQGRKTIYVECPYEVKMVNKFLGSCKRRDQRF